MPGGGRAAAGAQVCPKCTAKGFRCAQTPHWKTWHWRAKKAKHELAWNVSLQVDSRAAMSQSLLILPSGQHRSYGHLQNQLTLPSMSHLHNWLYVVMARPAKTAVVNLPFLACEERVHVVR